ncbi:MAG: glycosyltransferase [Tissierellaceae bacterium]|nr:glycosyltransferase [Tissierellaceae bacterium]
MKILILSCNTGEGHNSAANALYKGFTNYGIECEIADTLLFSGKRNTKLVTTSFNSIIKRAPKVFGAAYEVSGMYSSTKMNSPIYYANTLYGKKLFRYIADKQFDTIICTHLFAMESMTYIRKKYPLNAKCYGVLTDYTCVPFLAETDINGYFVPHMDIKIECTNRGMPERKIFPTGIPVDPKFNKSIEKSRARELLGIPKDKKMYLIMTGGLGFGKVTKLCEILNSENSDEAYIYVLVGKNIDLKNTIDNNNKFANIVKTIEFTDKVNLYMSAADVLLSKPGGISSTEAAIVGVPLIHTLAIPGVETKNARFFAYKGMSINARTIEDAAYSTKMLGNNPVISEHMIEMQRQNINSNATDDIVKSIKELSLTVQIGINN